VRERERENKRERKKEREREREEEASRQLHFFDSEVSFSLLSFNGSDHMTTWIENCYQNKIPGEDLSIDYCGVHSSFLTFGVTVEFFQYRTLFRKTLFTEFLSSKYYQFFLTMVISNVGGGSGVFLALNE